MYIYIYTYTYPSVCVYFQSVLAFLKRTIDTKKLGSKLNYLVRYPILFMGCPWSATADLVRERVFTTADLARGRVSVTADLVRGRVSARVSAGPLALSRCTLILGCLLSGFDWTCSSDDDLLVRLSLARPMVTCSSGGDLLVQISCQRKRG